MRCWDWFGDRSLVVIDIALACCALEVEAALLGASALVSQARGSGPADHGTAEIALSDLRADDAVAIVVSGTVTDTVLPIVRNILAQAPGAKVISFGACASAGGPYWDSYAVTKGIAQIVDVDLFVPGCPPTPQALEEALGTLRDARSAGSSASGGGAAGSDVGESRWLRSAEGASRSPIAEEPRWLRSAEGASRSPIAEEPRWLRSAEGSDVGESRWLRSAEGASRSPIAEGPRWLRSAEGASRSPVPPAEGAS